MNNEILRIPPKAKNLFRIFSLLAKQLEVFIEQMKYLFILGRNIELSVAEVKAYLERKQRKVLDASLQKNALLVELEESLDAGSVDELGGVLSLGIVLCNVKDIDRKEVYFGEKNKFNYVIWDFSPEHIDEVSDYLKKRFRKEKLKTTEKKLTGKMGLQEGGKSYILSSNLVSEEYFVFDGYFGRIIEKCDYDEIEKRDMEKPVRRESLSISPRLAKIMINLAKVRDEEKLVDAFCGIGVILQEALLQDIRVIGIDSDAKAIKGSEKNMKWFKFPKKNFELINSDSSKVKLKDKPEVMVSEPDFGDTLRKMPTKQQAESMIKRYEKIMISVLRNMKKYVQKRFVFTSPYIKTALKGKDRIGADFKTLEKKTGLKLVKGFPISEFRENQIVGRQIVVFER